MSKNLCVNEEVRRLGALQLINDCCMEMQKNKHGRNTSSLGKQSLIKLVGESGDSVLCQSVLVREW